MLPTLIGLRVKPSVVEVSHLTEGDRVRVNVSVFYPGDPNWPDPFNPTPQDELNGQLNVYMVEDNIWVYSSNLDESIMTHNAFRGYPKDLSNGNRLYQVDFTILPDEWYNISAVYNIPTDLTIPIKSQDLFPIAALYDQVGHPENSRMLGTDGWSDATIVAVCSELD